MTIGATLSLRRISRLAPYAAAAAFFALALGVGIAGALTGSIFLVVGSVGTLILALAVGAAIAYRRLIRVAQRTQRTSQMTLSQLAQLAKVDASADRPADTPRKGTSTGLGSLEWWSGSAGLSSTQVVQRLTVLRSVAGRDLLAKMATRGTWTWNEVARALEAYRMGGIPQNNVIPVFEGSSRLRLLQLADLCFRQNCLPQDLENVATLYSIIYDLDGSAQFAGKQRGEFFLDALSKTGQSRKACALLPLLQGRVSDPDQILFEANVNHPRTLTEVSEEQWLDSLNRVYRAAGLAGIRLTPGTGPAFLRLEAEATEPVVDGPLVSIVMPIYQPDEVTEKAVESALSQTYRHLQIIIVDDGSDEAYTARLDRWRTVDERVTVLLNEANAGAYTSRNVGYRAARGKYLTVFDGDDWQHPQKVELLVRQAEEAASDRLVTARWARVDEDLFFQYRGWRGAFITPAHVSALFPVDLVREKLGHWDSVRKAADTEFILRYQLLINNESPTEVTDAPLTLSLVGTANLSIGDFRLGYRSPDRVAYRASYEYWHHKISLGKEDGYLDFPQSGRRFPAPARFLPDRPELPHLDVLLVGDFSVSSKDLPELKAALERLLTDGYRTGVLHLPSVTGQSVSDALDHHLMDLFVQGRVTQVQKTDSVTTAVGIVTDATAFQFESFISGSVRPLNLYVTAQFPPYEATTERHTYEVSTVSENLFREYGIRPVWVPTAENASEVLSRVVSEVDFLPLSNDYEAEAELFPQISSAGIYLDRTTYTSHLLRILDHSRLHISKGEPL